MVILFSAEVLAPALLLFGWFIIAFVGYNSSADFRQVWHQHMGGHYYEEPYTPPLSEKIANKMAQAKRRAWVLLKRADVLLNRNLW